ncbi:MAG: 4-hydroxy-tetrahydrodipicolinate reductase [Spirochaetaceae bacterium]
MKAVICGYGRMGHEVERVLERRGHKIVARIDPAAGVGDHDAVSAAPFGDAEVVIEFSDGQAVLTNAKAYAEAGISAVVGTTGWEAEFYAVQDTVERAGIGYLIGANFSVGANLFMRIAAEAARLVNRIPDYDLLIHEAHHRFKKDSPSGTALKLATKVLEHVERKDTLVSEVLHRPIEENELHVSSVRGGNVPGTHRLTLDSEADSIEISHIARNRSGFALGAVMAAEWVRERSGFLTVEDFLSDLLT